MFEVILRNVAIINLLRKNLTNLLNYGLIRLEELIYVVERIGYSFTQKVVVTVTLQSIILYKIPVKGGWQSK